MKLYYTPGACSLASHIALQESGFPFEIDKLNASTKTTSAGEDYLQINPKGYVPAIRLNNGIVLTECAVILQYIADQKPDSGLAPKAGTMERYRLQEWLNFIGTEIHKSYGPLFNKTTTDEVKNSARILLSKRLAYVESQLANKPYLMGSNFTVADAYMFVTLSWSDHAGFDLSQFPRIEEYVAKIRIRPAVHAAMKAEGLIK